MLVYVWAHDYVDY